MIEIRPRETVILAANFSLLVKWYQEVLGFRITQIFEDDYHYCNLETQSRIKIGISDAKEMGVVLRAREHNSVVLQFEVDDIQEFFQFLKKNGATITGGPSFDNNDQFWFGSFTDPEGNPYWVVDKNCP